MSKGPQSFCDATVCHALLVAYLIRRQVRDAVDWFSRGGSTSQRAAASAAELAGAVRLPDRVGAGQQAISQVADPARRGSARRRRRRRRDRGDGRRIVATLSVRLRVTTATVIPYPGGINASNA